MNRHYHPHEVFASTISGTWGYLEHNWTATAGDVYETPGEAHTLVAYESDEPIKVHFKVRGPLIWLDEEGEAVDFFDVDHDIRLCKEHYEKVGLGAGYIDSLMRGTSEGRQPAPGAPPAPRRGPTLRAMPVVAASGARCA